MPSRNLKTIIRRALVESQAARKDYLTQTEEAVRAIQQAFPDLTASEALVTRQGRLAGVFTSVDACRCFGEYIRENFPRPDGDEAA